MTNKLIYQVETDSQTHHRQACGCQGGEGREGKDGETGLSGCKLSYTERINKAHSAGNCAKHPTMPCNRKEHEKEYTFV